MIVTAMRVPVPPARAPIRSAATERRPRIVDRGWSKTTPHVSEQVRPGYQNRRIHASHVGTACKPFIIDESNLSQMGQSWNLVFCGRTCTHPLVISILIHVGNITKYSRRRFVFEFL